MESSLQVIQDLLISSDEIGSKLENTENQLEAAQTALREAEGNLDTARKERDAALNGLEKWKEECSRLEDELQLSQDEVERLGEAVQQEKERYQELQTAEKKKFDELQNTTRQQYEDLQNEAKRQCDEIRGQLLETEKRDEEMLEQAIQQSERSLSNMADKHCNELLILENRCRELEEELASVALRASSEVNPSLGTRETQQALEESRSLQKSEERQHDLGVRTEDPNNASAQETSQFFECQQYPEEHIQDLSTTSTPEPSRDLAYQEHLKEYIQDPNTTSTRETSPDLAHQQHPKEHTQYPNAASAWQTSPYSAYQPYRKKQIQDRNTAFARKTSPYLAYQQNSGLGTASQLETSQCSPPRRRYSEERIQDLDSTFALTTDKYEQKLSSVSNSHSKQLEKTGRDRPGMRNTLKRERRAKGAEIPAQGKTERDVETSSLEEIIKITPKNTRKGAKRIQELLYPIEDIVSSTSWAIDSARRRITPHTHGQEAIIICARRSYYADNLVKSCFEGVVSAIRSRTVKTHVGYIFQERSYCHEFRSHSPKTDQYMSWDSFAPVTQDNSPTYYVALLQVCGMVDCFRRQYPNSVCRVVFIGDGRSDALPTIHGLNHYALEILKPSGVRIDTICVGGSIPEFEEIARETGGKNFPPGDDDKLFSAIGDTSRRGILSKWSRNYFSEGLTAKRRRGERK
jgi:hypothetical protein